jgi:hypothetical protein
LLLKRVASEFQTRNGAEKMRQWALSLPDRTNLDFLKRTKNVFAPLDLSDPAKAAASLTVEQRKNQLESLAQVWAENLQGKRNKSNVRNFLRITRVPYRLIVNEF